MQQFIEAHPVICSQNYDGKVWGKKKTARRTLSYNEPHVLSMV